MPRANRYFLPGHIWHITHLNSSPVPNVQAVQSLRFVQDVDEDDSDMNFQSYRKTRSAPLFALVVRSEEALRFVRPASGSSKRLRVVARCVTIAGRKQLRSGVWCLSRASRASSAAAERCIAALSRKTEPMRCVNAMRLTTVISAFQSSSCFNHPAPQTKDQERSRIGG
jgi:hypothetical protein